LGNEVWEFQKTLRKVEYLQSKGSGVITTIRYALAWRKLYRLSIRLGFGIHPHNFGPGLSIGHPGTLIVNQAARIGTNCRIHPCTVIGTQAGFSDKAAKIGNNVYIGPGVKISGEITIADNIAIGANSVVIESFLEPGITIAGIPAKKVSDKGSDGLLIKGSELAIRKHRPDLG
jgi:serine O-acetyltransferase